MSDEYVIRIVPDSVDSGSSKKRGSGGGLLGGMGGKLGAILGIAGIALSVLRPIMPMIKGLGKLLGEFLRPIADIIMMLLAPILSLMRPILITFKALMAPFKQAAMVGIAAGQKLIGQGMQIGGDKGTELVSAGFAGSLSAASLMMSGFTEILYAPLADLLGFGEEWEKIMHKWQSSAIAGIYKVTEKSALIDEVWENIGDVPLSTIKKHFGIINTYVDELKDAVGGFKIEDFQTNLTIVQTDLDKVFDPFVEFITEGGDLATYVTDATGVMDGLAVTFPETATTIGESITTVMSDWQTAIDNMDLEEQASLMMRGADALKAQLEGMEETTFGEKIKQVLLGIGEGMIGRGWLWDLDWEGFEEDKASWITDVAAARKAVTDDYLLLFPDVQAAQKEGLKQQLTDIGLYFDPINGEVVTTFDSGLSTMNTNTGLFTTSVEGYGTRVKTTSEEIDGYLDRAKSAATSAESSANKAKASAQSSSLWAVT